MANTSESLGLTPFANRLQTNYTPSPGESDQIKDIIKSISVEISDLEIEAARILEPFRRKHDLLLEQLSSHRRLLSPVRRLPVEILREVFLCCLSNNPDSWMKQYECPLLLTRVCSRWRRLALSMPQLWSIIHAVIPGDSAPRVIVSAQKRVTAIQQWLLRAGASPLHITFADCQIQPTSAFFSHSALFAEIIQASTLWEDFTIILGPHSMHHIATLSATELPLLDTLSVNQPNGASENLSHSGLMAAPNLRKLSLDITENIATLNCMWSNLTNLTIRTDNCRTLSLTSQLSLDALVKILGQCSHLRRFQLESNLLRPQDVSANTTEPREVILPALHFICFRLGTVDIDPLLSSLRLPSLESLTFQSEREVAKITQFLPFLSRCVGTIRSITINHKHFPRDALLDCLKACPKLRSLQLFNAKPKPSWPQPTNPEPSIHTMTDALLDALSPPKGDYASDCPCPRLEHLEVMDAVQISEERLIEFIMQRQILHQTRGIAKLKVLRILNSFATPRMVDFLA